MTASRGERMRARALELCPKPLQGFQAQLVLSTVARALRVQPAVDVEGGDEGGEDDNAVGPG